MLHFKSTDIYLEYNNTKYFDIKVIYLSTMYISKVVINHLYTKWYIYFIIIGRKYYKISQTPYPSHNNIIIYYETASNMYI